MINNTSTLRRIKAVLAAFGCAAALGHGAAMAQPVPVRILVGFPAGGGVDTVARLLAERLEKQTGRPHLVDNRPGAAGMLAVRALASAPADGTTLMVAPDSAVLVAPYTLTTPGLNVGTDLAPVSRLTSYDFALSVRAADAGPRSLQALHDAARAHPEGITIANPGAGGLLHFYSIALAKDVGLKATHVPYRGVAPAIVDTIGGEVNALLTPIGPVLQHATGPGAKLRILATTGAERGAKTPDVPTMKELGYAQLSSGGWFGLFAPGKTSPELVRSIAESARQALADPAMQPKLVALDMDAAWNSPQEFRKMVDTESRRWSAVVKSSGFKADQ